MKGEEANWKILPNYFLNVFGEKFLIFKMNLDKLKNIENSRTFSIPEFFTDIIETWLEIKMPIKIHKLKRSTKFGNKFYGEIKKSNI